jgi:hypothetical protein
MQDAQSLWNKIQALPVSRIEEVEDFVDFLAARERERELTPQAAEASVSAFQAIWDNPDDDVYDVIARSEATKQPRSLVT